MAMTYGIHLPQYGRVASGDAVARAARHAEELGFADVWVSDHIVHPAEQPYPSPFLLDPFATLGWAAAVTSRVRLGTSVLVVPQHNPVVSASGGQGRRVPRRRLEANRGGADRGAPPA